MARDPVAALLRMRGFATREARRILGLRVQSEFAAGAEAAARAAAPAREQAEGGDPLLIAAWMPRALADAARAAAQSSHATRMRDSAQAALAEARRQERVLGSLAAARAAERALLAARREQARLDDRAGALHDAGGRIR
ncbi:MAG: hypothetical protein V4653_04395 [Pseudomonadota bacterium]